MANFGTTIGNNPKYWEDIMLHPDEWSGLAIDCAITKMGWIKEFGRDTYCALWQRWPSRKSIYNLPIGYNLYITSFHLEAVEVEWLWQQAKHIDAPIIVLTESQQYDCPLPKNVHFHKFYWWHEQCDLIQKWHPNKITKNITHQFSAITSRITQSKLLITTALLENKTKSMIRLSKWRNEDSVNKNNNKLLDYYHDIFYKKWYGNEIYLEDTLTKFRNEQIYTSNPWTDPYQKCALHFTNESFHYSLKHDQLGEYIYPGPFITEKTLKCLAGATGFVPVGQFDTYKALQDVGFKFDYGFRQDFDEECGDISRLVSIVKLIEELATWNNDELFEATKESSLYNQDYIYSQDFYKFCDNQNLQTINFLCQKYN